MSLRIAMVGACPYPVPQGSQVFLRETALALRERGHEVHLIVYGHGEGHDASGLTVHRCMRLPGDRRIAAGPSPMKPFLDLALLRKVRQVVRTHEIELVCAHNYEGLLVALAAGKRPIIYFAHNAMSDELPYYFRFKTAAEYVGRWLDHTFPRRADLIIAPHQRLAGHLVVRGCDHERLMVVPPPLDASAFEACPIGSELPPVLYAGNLDAYQNFGLLQAAMQIVRQQAPEARLLLATGVRDAARHVDLAGIELIYTADLQALQEVLAQDVVFAVPRVSWSGYPIKLLNAMAAGKAVVVCESAAYTINSGVNGLVVTDNDSKAFAAALLQLMMTSSLRKNLGLKARETILNAHEPAKAAEALEAAFQKVLPVPEPAAAEEEAS